MSTTPDHQQSSLQDHVERNECDHCGDEYPAHAQVRGYCSAACFYRQKGAHVLAALDAEIRRRTDGEHTLRDVFNGRTESFENYRAFRAAVVEVTGDESLGAWLDRYATTDALPPLPEDPRYYVADPSLDPDGDGMTSGAELDADRHPFVEGAASERLDDRRTTTGTPADASSEMPTDADAETTAEPTGTDGQAPGFGVVAALAALAALVVGVRRQK